MKPLRRTIALGLMLSAPAFAAPLPPVEPMPTLDAAILAPAKLLSGTGYTVDSSVPVVGYLGQFTLRAPAGTFSADGTEMLSIRISELAAIAKLNELSQTGEFANAIAASAMKTGASIGRAVLNPVGTISGIPGGVGHFFQSAATSISRATESTGGSGDAAMDMLGINEAKRRIAGQVGADPYTTNPVLTKQLDDLASAAVTGGVSLDVALAVTTAGVGTAISATTTVSDLVWNQSPDDVRTINERNLGAMGVRADTIRAFVTNRWMTPTLSLPFVEHLGQMPAAKGRAEVVALASSVASEGEARFLLNAVSMTRRLNTEADPVVALELDGGIVVVRTRSGRIEVPAPVDYVVWTEQVRAFADREDMRATRHNVLITGLASAQAREGLKATGWAMQENSSR